MKIRTLIIILFFFLYNCKDYKYSELIVHTKNEHKNSAYLPLNQMMIYKDGKLYKKIEPKDGLFIENPIKLDSLEKGLYKFEYLNLFDEKTSTFYTAKNKKKKDSLTIYTDFFDSSKFLTKSIIKNLKNDSLKINYQSIGCFHKENDSLIIKENNSQYFLYYKNKITVLNDTQINRLIRFECELYSLPKQGFCTTKETYVLNFKGRKKKIINGNCVWSGWKNIKEDFRLN